MSKPPTIERYVSSPIHDKMHSSIFKRLSVLAVLVGLTLSVPMSNVTAGGNLQSSIDDQPTLMDFFEFLRNLFTPCEYPPDPEEIEAKNISLTGLSRNCAETIWCRYRLYKKQRHWDNSTHTALLWPDITRQKAEKLFDSHILNGTLFNESEDSMWDGNWIHTYAGQWNFEQICYLLKRKEARLFIRILFPANLIGSRYSFLCSIRLRLGLKRDKYTEMLFSRRLTVEDHIILTRMAWVFVVSRSLFDSKHFKRCRPVNSPSRVKSQR
jgi:hypothetical protein